MIHGNVPIKIFSIPNSFFVNVCIFIGSAAILVLGNHRLYAAPLDGASLAPAAAISPAEARSRVLAAADKYEHTPYRYGGLDGRGLDCSGLVYLSFYDALGVAVPRSTWSLYSWVEKISINDARPGDLVFFATTGGGSVSHVGIFVGDGRFIHAASEGPVTGVIYSRLDERYWSRTYVGAGRVLPEAEAEAGVDNSPDHKRMTRVKEEKAPDDEKRKEEGRVLIGFAAAPTWNMLIPGEGAVRGIAGQLRVGLEIKPFGQPMIFGMELRPEWDRALDVFRLPITFSWGINDQFRIFAGPAVSFGDAVMIFSGKSRYYTGGTNWFGAAGITVAPFPLKIMRVRLAPYGELAWQSYYSNNAQKNFRADFAAGFRFSTGLSCTWRSIALNSQKDQ